MIQAGEPIVLDIGGTFGGYGSDTTRTLWVTGGDPANGPDERVPAPVRRPAGRPGRGDGARSGRASPAEAIDAAARDVIAAEGYGEAFFHRTGHGIGLEGHEEPYLVAGNAEPLGAGMAFSIEPGIYLAGPLRRPDRGHRRLRRRWPGSSSTTIRASCGSWPASRPAPPAPRKSRPAAVSSATAGRLRPRPWLNR